MAIFWKEGCDFSIDIYSSNHIDAIVNKGKEDEWRFTGFYDEPDTNNRLKSLARVRRLKSKLTIPWLCAGDFNEIAEADEILGGRLRPVKQMEAFKDVLDECGFKDLGFVGDKYTWCRGSRGDNTIWERLDKAIATTDWIELFPATKVLHLECRSSDHKHLIILPKGIQNKRRKPWRFKQICLEDASCSEVIDLVWRQDFPSSLIDQVEGKIQECQEKLN